MALIQTGIRRTLKPLNSRKTLLIDLYKHNTETHPLIIYLHYKSLPKDVQAGLNTCASKSNASFTVIRNNLYKVYLSLAHMPDPCAKVKRKNRAMDHPLLPIFKGPSAAMFLKDMDPKQVKSILRYIDIHGEANLEVVGAKIGDELVVGSDKLKQFSLLPSLEGLHGQLLSVLTSGASGLVNMLQTPARSLVNIGKHISKDTETPKQD